MTRTPSKFLAALLSLFFCGSMLVLTSGCSVLFPTPYVEPDKPDNKPDDPAPAPKDPYNAVAGMSKALLEDMVPRSQAILLSGVFAGTADYVQGLPNSTELTTTGLGERMEIMLERVGWPHNKYLKVKGEISRIWTAMDFEDAKALSDSAVKQKLLDTYRNMADGCAAAVGRIK